MQRCSAKVILLVKVDPSHKQLTNDIGFAGLACQMQSISGIRSPKVYINAASYEFSDLSF
jgi:hypothetical protein